MSLFANAQQPVNSKSGGRNMNIGHFYGKVVDAKTGKGLEAVSIQLIGTQAGGQFRIIERLPGRVGYRFAASGTGGIPDS